MADNSVITKVTGTDTSTNRIASTFYGTCSTGASTAAKAVTLSDSCVFNDSCLVTGVTIHVKFTNSNANSTPTLQVGTATAKQIMKYGTTKAGATADTSWQAGSVVSFTYDGTYWQMNDHLDTADVKVTQTATSTNSTYEVLFSNSANNTTETAGARKNNNLTFNPSTGTLDATATGTNLKAAVRSDIRVELTQAQYDALVSAGTVDSNIIYLITDRNNSAPTYASGISYDNSSSGLSATTVQAAIDEIVDDEMSSISVTIPSSGWVFNSTDGYWYNSVTVLGISANDNYEVIGFIPSAIVSENSLLKSILGTIAYGITETDSITFINFNENAPSMPITVVLRKVYL